MVDIEADTAPRITYRDAVNLALRHALAQHPEAIVFGEDVAIPGGVFGCTKGLADEFPGRVFDTPISESAILGAAVGASLMGRRPIVEVMWADFVLVALDQVINQAANVRYASQGKLSAPLTVRTQEGALPGSCAQHSQSLEVLFAHIPGLLVANPSNAGDAYGMLRAAIAADDPAIVIEHRGLYPIEGDAIGLNGPIEQIGGARVCRSGTGATVITYGSMVDKALAAADRLSLEGTDVEVIDLRWLRPLDVETIVTSVRKTGHVVVAHEAHVTAGFGAEISAIIMRDAFWWLEAPIERVGTPDVRVPAAPSLQAAVIPSAQTVEFAVRSVLDEARS